MKNEASKHIVRTTNIVFISKSKKNLTDNTPAKAASCGNIGRGPFKKNLVIPNEPEKRLRIKVKLAKDISYFVSPQVVFGKNASVVKMMQRVVRT